MLSQTPHSNELFFTILSEMDEHERRRKRGGSNSSVESFTSSNMSPNSPTMKESLREGGSRKSITFARRSEDGNGRRSLDERPKGEMFGLSGLGHGHGHGNGREALVGKVKGRLRALTGERRRDTNIKPYPET
jgi:hypothetical protein